MRLGFRVLAVRAQRLARTGVRRIVVQTQVTVAHFRHQQGRDETDS